MLYGSVMTTITLKNVPELLRVALRTRAKANRRSLNQEVLYCLERSVEKNAGGPESRIDEQGREWRAQSARVLTKVWDNDEDEVYNALLEK